MIENSSKTETILARVSLGWQGELNFLRLEGPDCQLSGQPIQSPAFHRYLTLLFLLAEIELLSKIFIL